MLIASPARSLLINWEAGGARCHNKFRENSEIAQNVISILQNMNKKVLISFQGMSKRRCELGWEEGEEGEGGLGWGNPSRARPSVAGAPSQVPKGLIHPSTPIHSHILNQAIIANGGNQTLPKYFCFYRELSVVLGQVCIHIDSQDLIPFCTYLFPHEKSFFKLKICYRSDCLIFVFPLFPAKNLSRAQDILLERLPKCQKSF